MSDRRTDAERAADYTNELLSKMEDLLSEILSLLKRIAEKVD